MVEELKVVADILAKVSDGALKGVIFYFIFAYVKPVTLWGMSGFILVKLATILKPERAVVNAVSIEDL